MVLSFLMLMVLAQAAGAGDSATLLARAAVAVEAKRLVEAQSLLEEAHRLWPEDPEPDYQLAWVLLQKEGPVDRAVDLLEEAVARGPGVSGYHLALGMAYSRQASEGKFTALRLAGKIKVEFLRAVELAPASVPAHQALHGFYLRAPGILGGSVEKAAEQAAALDALDPFAGPAAWMAIHAQRKAWAESDLAARAAARAASNDKQRARLSNLLIAQGYEALEAGEAGRAIGAFRLATEVEPSNPNTFDSLGEALVVQGDWVAAEAMYRRSLSLDPPPRVAAASRFGLGRALEGRGEKAGARAAYQAALDGSPERELTKKTRARLEALGDPPKP
jgi:tetratricopeptide (TPR) repeat protein